LILAGIALTAAGVGVLLAALNVAYRDFRYVIPFMMQLWMFATPAIYMEPTAAPPRGLHALLVANPMNALVAAFRASVSGRPIDWPHLGISLAGGLFLLLVGCLYFRSAEDTFADRV
jgi:lipopolysaccharide transport system permease protein